MCDKIVQFLKGIHIVAYINAAVCFADMLVGKEAFSQADATIRVLFLILSFYAGNWMGKHYRELCGRKVKKAPIILACALCLYAAFTLVGNVCFIYPLTMNVTLLDVAVYVMTVIWVTPIILWVCYRLIYHRPVVVNSDGLPIKLAVASTVIFGIVIAIFVAAYNPCIGTYDTVYTMTLAVTTGARGMMDYQPPFYVMFLQGILSLWKSPYAVVIVQIVFFLYVYWRAVCLLWKRGMRESGVIKCLLFTVFSINILIFLITIWKDIPYTLSILWLTVILAHFLSGEQKGYTYVELASALVCVFFFRQNGIVPFVLTCVVVPFAIRKMKIWLSVLSAIVIVILIKFPLYDSLDIERSNGGMAYVGLGLDVAGVYYNGGILSEEAMDFVTEMTGNPDTYEYSPYKLENISTDIDISMKDFIKIYWDTFIHNPKLVVRGVLCRSDGVWNLLNGVGGGVRGATITNASESADTTWLSYFPGREENALTGKLNFLVAYVIWKNITGMFMGRTGVWTLLFLIAVSVIIYKRRYKYLVITVPCIGQMISLLLAVGWSDYRYIIPIEFMSVFIIAFVYLLEEKRWEEEKDEQSLG